MSTQETVFLSAKKSINFEIILMSPTMPFSNKIKIYYAAIQWHKNIGRFFSEKSAKLDLREKN